ncbi:MAG: hypothetical protein D8B38_06210 [Candidatus Saccharimonas sp.]|nr:MAG: hypothetical protein D8B38_06210 [Candidatus Saccharimonas sp.]
MCSLIPCGSLDAGKEDSPIAIISFEGFKDCIMTGLQFLIKFWQTSTICIIACTVNLTDN